MTRNARRTNPVEIKDRAGAVLLVYPQGHIAEVPGVTGMSYIDLQGANLGGANLQGAYLQGANLRRVYLGGANLRGANLREADLRGANLREADLREADLREADLGGANLGGADLRGANLQDADLEGAYLEGAYLQDANLREADLREADLRGANLREADLREADLREADLREADLEGANLGGADLGGADLREADLEGANLEGANLEGTILEVQEVQEVYPPAASRVLHTFQDGSYVLDLTPTEMVEEGIALNHCMKEPSRGYIKAVKTKRAKALSIRTSTGRSKLTVFVSLDDTGRPESISQIRGKSNRYPGWDLDKEGVGKMKIDEVEKAIATIELLGLDPTQVADMQPALRHLEGRRQEVLHPRTNPECGFAGHGAGGFCCDYSPLWG